MVREGGGVGGEREGEGWVVMGEGGRGNHGSVLHVSNRKIR